MDNMLGPAKGCFIQQVKEWGEIIVGIENRNKYDVFDLDNKKIGHAAEVGKGFFKFIQRNILRAHRPLEIKFWDTQGKDLFYMKRPFFWFFSELTLFDALGNVMGVAHRKFGILKKRYELHDHQGKLFAKVEGPIWKLWQFPILDLSGNKWGLITKKWGGFMKEIFTDADTFLVEFPESINEVQKAIVLATAFSIDLDFFENNNKSSSHTSWNS